MRRFLATVSNCAPALTPALLALAMMPLSPSAALSDPSGADPSTPVTPAPACSSNEAASPQAEPSSSGGLACEDAERTHEEIADARAYVIETASPGYTMTLQGPELAIGRLHPEFVVRLANAIREARGAGLPFAGVFSAYRPPAFGVGGFSDKFNSLHTYGLAVDMQGIGRPGSPEALLWHEIAARNGVVCPYGPHDRAEWNHCQPTGVKMILAQNPLRETVSAAGPFDLESMFEAGNRMIESMASAAESLYRAAPTPVRALEASAHGLEPTVQVASSRRTKRNSRTAATRTAAKAITTRTAAKTATTRVGAKAAAERIAAKAAPHPKLSARQGEKTASLATADGRRKSKSGRG
jgi:hypothetical protein